MSNVAWSLRVILCLTCFAAGCLYAEGFRSHLYHSAVNAEPSVLQPYRPKTSCTGHLCAKKSKKVRSSVTGTGFGGAGAETCSCGSDVSYNKCCGMLHRDTKIYAAAKAEEVVRARYTAYAKRVIDFIIESTHPLNKNFEEDIQHWRDSIDLNCYDNFELTKCEILDESYQGEGPEELATVRFQANMRHRETRENTAFMETSTFERDPLSGAWLYRDGIVAPVEGSDVDATSLES